MPDPTKQTVSATQIAALFNRSKWDTRWTLYKRFLGEGPPDFQDARMSWGTKLQPLVLEQAGEDLKLQVRHTDFYETRGVIGCTRDAAIVCPDRGPGALETKCVFDYAQWMRAWGGGECVPVDYEMQLQAQMYVGYGDQPNSSFAWGVIAAWVCGDMHYFERTPDEGFQSVMSVEAQSFLAQVAGKIEAPDPMGDPLELPTIAATWGEVVPKKEIDLSGFEDALPIAEAARMFDHARSQVSFWKKTQDHNKAKLLAASEDAAKLILPQGVYVDVSKGKQTRIKVSQYDTGPGDLPDTPVFG